MDDKTRAEIEAGRPIVIAHLDKKGHVVSEESYNMQNIGYDKYAFESLCRYLAEKCKEFYSDPENVKKYEEWAAQKEAEKNKK